MQNTFSDLLGLAKDDPEGYRKEMARIGREDPYLLSAFVEWLRRDLEKVTRPRRHESLLALLTPVQG